VQLYALPSQYPLTEEMVKPIPVTPQLKSTNFKLELPLGVQYSIYLRIKNPNRPLIFRLSLLSSDYMVKSVASDHMFYAFILGGLLVMSIYNLLMFFNLDEASYLSLFIFILSNFFVLSSQSGMLSILLSEIDVGHITPIAAMLTIVSGNRFFYQLMSISINLPSWSGLFNIHFLISIFFLLTIHFIPFQVFYITFLGSIFLLVSMSGLLILYKDNIPEARGFIWPFIVILISCIPMLLYGIELFNDSVMALNILMLGFLLFIVLLSLSQSTRTRQLRDQAQQSEAANKAKDALLMTMSHELRTPMHAVVSSGTLLQQTQLTAQQSNYVSKLQVSAQHMLSLINNILDVSRMSHVKPEINEQPFNLQSVLERLEKLLGDQARQKGLKFELISDYPTDIVLIGDPMRLSQVLLNLLDNAVKFTDLGSITLRIKPIGQWLNNIELSFTVVDTGLGLSLKEQERIFEPFFQANSSSNRRHKGTGLGLTISHNLVKHLGGELQVKSKSAQGSSFSFKLFFELADQQTLLPAPTASVILKQDYQDKTVLLVDDDPLNQFFGQELLSALGVQVDVVASGDATLMALKFRAYDLVFMDVSMPDLDGYQTTQLIRNDLGLHTLPIVALTAHAIAGERERCLAAGMSDYLAKPFSIQELEGILVKWLIVKNS
ncbi:MAG: response regulator, partial [Thiothrix sp.]